MSLAVTQLIGFGAGGGSLSLLSYVNSAVSALPTITIPADAAAGDVGVLFDLAFHSGAASAPTTVVPTGWTSLKNNSQTTTTSTDSGIRGIASYKILDSGDPGALITGMDDTAEDKVMMVFRGDASIATVTPSTWKGDTGHDTDDGPGGISSQAISASGVSGLLVVLGAVGRNSSTASFSTESPAFTAKVSNSESDVIMGYTIYNSSPQDHTVDAANSANPWTVLMSGYLVLS